VVLAGNGPVKMVCASVSVAGPTVTHPLAELSAPCQFVPMTGVTVYFQVPVGTADSMHVVAATVPVHLESIVCSASAPAS
jgi:hypothetical protein